MDAKMLYRVREVATQLSVSRSKVYELIRSGALVSLRLDGSRRVEGREVTAYLDRLRESRDAA
jgi:excisionase family DNA binding protein